MKKNNEEINISYMSAQEPNKSALIRTCPICLDEITVSLYFLPCWHAYHENCLQVWIAKNLYCPLCRIPFFIDSPEILMEFNKFTEDQQNDAKARADNLGMDVNSIAYRFMRKNNIPNLFNYNDTRRIMDLYQGLIDITDIQLETPLLEPVSRRDNLVIRIPRPFRGQYGPPTPIIPRPSENDDYGENENHENDENVEDVEDEENEENENDENVEDEENDENDENVEDEEDEENENNAYGENDENE